MIALTFTVSIIWDVMLKQTGPEIEIELKLEQVIGIKKFGF